MLESVSKRPTDTPVVPHLPFLQMELRSCYTNHPVTTKLPETKHYRVLRVLSEKQKNREMFGTPELGNCYKYMGKPVEKIFAKIRVAK